MLFSIFHKVFLSKTTIYGRLFSLKLKTFPIESIFSPTKVLIQQIVNSRVISVGPRSTLQH